MKTSGICALALLIAAGAFAQPLDGTPITFSEGTLPMLSDAGFVPINTEAPLLLGQDPDNDDREPQTCVLADGTVIVFWVNRGGSHHFSGMNPDGSRIYDVFGSGQDDVIAGTNTGGNTNWTICENSIDGTQFIVAATWKVSQMGGSDLVIPATVGDADGVKEDDGQGHGFFKIYDMDLNEVTSGPVSVGQVSLGHRDWGAAGLSNGGWAFGVMSRDHRWADDPDGDFSSRTGFVNIFNADGTRAVDEFAPRYVGNYAGRFQIAPLSNGFAYVSRNENGDAVNEFIIFDNAGNELNAIPMADTTILGTADAPFLGSYQWMAGAGTSTFWVMYGATGSEAMAALGMPEDLIGSSLLLAAQYDSSGLLGYTLVTTHSDFDVGSPDRPRIAMAANGSFSCSWEDELSNDVDLVPTMAFRVFNADGTPASVEALACDLPEYAGGVGEPGEPMIGMNDDFISLTWGSRAYSNGANRDVVVNVVANPAEGSSVEGWELH